MQHTRSYSHQPYVYEGSIAAWPTGKIGPNDYQEQINFPENYTKARFLSIDKPTAKENAFGSYMVFLSQ